MEETQVTLEDNLRMKESMEWGFTYYTGELNQLGYTHQAKDNELEVYDGEGTLVGKSYLEKEGHVTSRKFEAITSVPPQVEELSNHLLLYQITMGSTERDIALLQQESLVKETAVKYGSKEEVPARIFPAVEHGNLKNISFEGIPSEEARNYLKEHKDFNLMPGRQLFEEVGMEQMAAQTTITSTFPRHQKHEMASLGLFVAEEKKEYESFLRQIDDYLERGKTPSYHQFLISKTPRILTFTGLPDNEISLSTSVLNKAKKIHGLDNKEIMNSVKGLFNPILVFNSDKSTSEAKNDSVLVITKATAKNGKPVALALELEKKLTNRKPVYVVNDIRSIHDRNLVAQNGVDILKEWMDKGLLRYYDDKKISDWLAIKRVQFPLSLTKSDIDTITLKDNSVKTRSQFENSMKTQLHLESTLPEKLLTPAQIREGTHQLPVKQEFMEKNNFFPPMELTKGGKVLLHCTTKDLNDGLSQKNTPIVMELTSKQAAVLIDASIKQRFMDNRQAKQPTPLNIAAKSKMEENFFTGLKSVHPQLTRKEADKQYHQVYSLIEKELKELRHEPVKQKSISRKSSGMEW